MTLFNDVVRAFLDEGYPVYEVGGAVRDRLMGRERVQTET